MPETVSVREARRSDREQLVEMRLLMQRHMETSNPNIWQMTEDGIREIDGEIDGMFAKEGGRTFVAEADGDVLGFVHGHVVHRINYTPRNVGFIEYLYVIEPFRRMGIGTLLVRELCKFFKDQKVQEVNLRYVIGNREGEEFWKRLGFTPIIKTASTSLEAIESRLS